MTAPEPPTPEPSGVILPATGGFILDDTTVSSVEYPKYIKFTSGAVRATRLETPDEKRINAMAAEIAKLSSELAGMRSVAESRAKRLDRFKDRIAAQQARINRLFDLNNAASPGLAGVLEVYAGLMELFREVYDLTEDDIEECRRDL